MVLLLVDREKTVSLVIIDTLMLLRTYFLRNSVSSVEN